MAGRVGCLLTSLRQAAVHAQLRGCRLTKRWRVSHSARLVVRRILARWSFEIGDGGEMDSDARNGTCSCRIPRGTLALRAGCHGRRRSRGKQRGGSCRASGAARAGSVRQQIHDGDTINVKASGNFGVPFLGLDAPVVSFTLPGETAFTGSRTPCGRSTSAARSPCPAKTSR